MQAVRCLHESQMHSRSCFLTLTYDDRHLPPFSTLQKSDLDNFFKRIRNHAKVRYFGCGEYGERTRRPHYHVLLFGYDFDHDREPVTVTGAGSTVYRSAFLEELWSLGHSSIGELNYQSAAYVARYCSKKWTVKDRDVYKMVLDEHTGEWFSERVPEFICASRRPAIGLDWFKQYYSDVYPSDFVIVNGQRLRSPRYYDRKLKQMYPELYESVKSDRELVDHADSSEARLLVQEEVLRRRLTLLKRGD